MNTPFLGRDSSALILLPENTNPNGKHMEFHDPQGMPFARMTKIFKEGWFLGFFSTFRSSPPVHAELKDLHGHLLLTTTSFWGLTAHECRVEIYDQPGGSLIGTLHGMPFGAEFAGPSGVRLGRALRLEEQASEQREVVYAYSDSSGQVVGTCDRRCPTRSDSLLKQGSDLLDFLYSGSVTSGVPVQLVTLTMPTDPVLHLFLHLFPALQNLRYTRHT